MSEEKDFSPAWEGFSYEELRKLLRQGWMNIFDEDLEPHLRKNFEKRMVVVLLEQKEEENKK